MGARTSYFREYGNRPLQIARQRVWTLRRHGLTVADYEQMLKEQGGGCGICGKVPTRESLMVDHDHNSGKIRGLLCRPCNRAIGMLGDQIDGLIRATDYLKGNRSGR